MEVELDELVDVDGIDNLNELADEKALNHFNKDSGMLSDISYRTVGFKAGDGKGVCSGRILVEVNANWEEY